LTNQVSAQALHSSAKEGGVARTGRGSYRCRRRKKLVEKKIESLEDGNQKMVELAEYGRERLDFAREV